MKIIVPFFFRGYCILKHDYVENATLVIIKVNSSNHTFKKENGMFSKNTKKEKKKRMEKRVDSFTSLYYYWFKTTSHQPKPIIYNFLFLYSNQNKTTPYLKSKY